MKAILKLNRCKVGGTRPELIERIAMNMAYGVCERCNRCGGFFRETITPGTKGCMGHFKCPVFLRFNILFI